MNFLFMLTYSGFHFRFLSFPCGFLFLPSSVNSLDFMSYANQSSESELIHHLGSSGWMKLDGFQSPPSSPQPPATRRMRVASGARPAGQGWGETNWQNRKGKGMFISLHHLGRGSLLSMQLFLKAQQSSWSPIWRWGPGELLRADSVSINCQELVLFIMVIG